MSFSQLLLKRDTFPYTTTHQKTITHKGTLPSDIKLCLEIRRVPYSDGNV